MSGDFWGSQEGCQGPSRPSGRTRGLPLRRRRGQGPHLAKRWDPRGFSRVAAAFSSYDGDLSLPLGLALGSPIFPSGCEGKLGVALESLRGRRDPFSQVLNSPTIERNNSIVGTKIEPKVYTWGPCLWLVCQSQCPQAPRDIESSNMEPAFQRGQHHLHFILGQITKTVSLSFPIC